MHSHREMEILTWVVDGSIVHEDSTGTRRTVPRNGLQKMSAGTGIAHSEYNPSDEERLHLVQIWIEPDRSGLEPSYEEARFPEADLRNRWRAVASGSGEAPVSIRQDATMYVAHPEAGRGLSHAPQGDRRIYLVMLRGRGTVNGSTMAAGDAARIRNEDRLAFQADDDSELLMLDLPS